MYLYNFCLILTEDDGFPRTELKDNAIPPALINQLHYLRLADAVTFTGNKLVPTGHSPHPFSTNVIPESYQNQLRSLVATCRFRHRLQQLEEQGVDFYYHLYVLEMDPLTGFFYHERGDHCHVLKRIWKHTQEGVPENFNVLAFDAALMDPNTGLTHAALTGVRKQSVSDAERMLSYLVSKFLRDNGYENEARDVETVAGWNEAADGRGLSELERCRKNHLFIYSIIHFAYM